MVDFEYKWGSPEADPKELQKQPQYLKSKFFKEFFVNSVYELTFGEKFFVRINISNKMREKDMEDQGR